MSPTVAQAESRSQRALQSARDKDLSDVVSQKRITLATTEEAFQKMLASQQARWAKEEQDHFDDVEQRKAEIAVLEEKRLKALMPVEDQKREYEALITAGKKVIEEYKEKQQECDRTQEIFEVRFDEVEDQRQKNAQEANRLHAKQLGIETQAAEVSRNAKEVSSGLETLRKDRILFDHSAKEKEDYLQARKVELDQRDQAQNERAEKLEARENRVRVLEIMYNSPVNQTPIHHG